MNFYLNLWLCPFNGWRKTIEYAGVQEKFVKKMFTNYSEKRTYLQVQIRLQY
jgi:hypothetical protein